MSASQHLAEFIQALAEEIKALKAGKGGSSTRVSNGRLVSENAGMFVYVFALENFLAVMDDTPVEIEIEGRKTSGQIVSVQGLEVHVALERSFGQSIAEATIRVNLWAILELIMKKMDEARSSSLASFEMSERVFSGQRTCVVDEHPFYDNSTSQPNASQIQAIAAAYQHSLQIIWGPPGTGKTRTIAKLVEAHVNAGNRVLLVSHANTAVDEALASIAEQFKPSDYYREGKILRLGVTHKQDLPEKYPLVVMEHIVAKKGESLTRERISLLAEQERIDALLDSAREYEAAKSELQAAEQTLSDAHTRLNHLKAEVNDIVQRIEPEQDRLAQAKASGFLKRLWTGLNPQQIEANIKRFEGQRESKLRAIEELQERVGYVSREAANRLTREKEAAKVFRQWLERERLTEESFTELRAEKDLRRKQIITRVGEIDKAIKALPTEVLQEARVVATTLTKTVTSREIQGVSFDVLVVDEISMAPLPLVYWASGKARKAVTLVGDFKQLPPICVSEESMAKKWLARSIFDVLNIKTVDQATNECRVSLLEKQYRMHPDIAAIPNELFYGGCLLSDPSTLARVLDSPFGGRSPLVLVDTSAANPWGSKLARGGRFNLYSALVTARLAHELLKDPELKRVGIVSPYRAQARLIGKIAKDWGMAEQMRVNTVHSFQGGEEEVIIIDCVDGAGLGNWSMLDCGSTEDAPLLANVAITRAKRKLYLVANRKHFNKTFPSSSVINKVINFFEKTGAIIGPDGLLDEYTAHDFAEYTEDLLGVTRQAMSGRQHSEKDFWPAFLHDLKSAASSVTLYSPFTAVARVSRMADLFRTLLSRGVEVKVHCRPPQEQGASLVEQAEVVIEKLKELGIQVIERKGMHQKIAIIDQRIVWEGSLNILSHRDTGEQMRRFEGVELATEVTRNLEPSAEENQRRPSTIVQNSRTPREGSQSNVSPGHCPQCAAKGFTSKLVKRTSRYGEFWGCSSYPRCDYKKS